MERLCILLLCMSGAAGSGIAQAVRASRVRYAQQPSTVQALPASATSRTPWRLARVLRVVDADTYEVEASGGRARVRLLGADAPEQDQPFGRQAAAEVSALVLRRYVWLRVQGLDAYGRNLAAVRLRPVAFSGQAAVALDSLLVVRGWAWAYSPGQTAADRAVQQQRAQDAGRGLWKCGPAAPVRPGVWRAFNRQEKSSHWGSCSW